MGVVSRQGITSSAISYLGVAIGYFNLVILYPKFLDLEQIGLIRTIQDAAILFAPFAQIGLGPSIIRFYPQFAKEKAGHNFMSFVLLMSLVGYGIFLLCFFIFKQPIYGYLQDKASDVLKYTDLVLWLTFGLLIMSVLEFYGRSLLKVSFPTFLREVFIRLLQTILVFLYFLKMISFHQLILFSVAIYFLSLCILIIYLISQGHLKIRMDTTAWNKSKFKKFFSFSFMTLVGNSSIMIISKIDSIMVTAMLGLALNTIYTTAFYFATVIEIPKRAFSQLIMPLLSEAVTVENQEEIKSLYRKTAINQLIIGSLILIGITANLHNIYQIMPKGESFSLGAYVVLIAGIGKWMDMAFGPGGEIIILSKYYWMNIVLTVLLAALVILANYFLIPLYGINGAALGTTLIILAFNLAKFFIVYRFLHMQPFTLKTVYVLLIGGVVVLLNYLLPVVNAPIIDGLYRSLIITVAFSALILLTNVSTEANRLYRDILKRIGIK